MSKSQLAASYAALLLQDGGVAITSDKIQEVLDAAGINDVETYWGALMCKVFETKNVTQLLIEGGGGAGGGASGGAAGGAAGGAEEVEEEKKEEEPEEEADVGGLFDSSGGDDAW